MRKPMTDEEWCNWKNTVKCNWLKCAGGMGLAGNGCCSFRGDYTLENCQRFITEEDYEKKYDTDNRKFQRCQPCIDAEVKEGE